MNSLVPDHPLIELLGHFPTIESPLDPEGECVHGRLPQDRNRPAECRCWDEETAT